MGAGGEGGKESEWVLEGEGGKESEWVLEGRVEGGKESEWKGK